MAYMEEKTCLRFIKWTSDMPSKTKMTFMANFGGIAKYGDCSTNWSRKDGRIVYSAHSKVLLLRAYLKVIFCENLGFFIHFG